MNVGLYLIIKNKIIILNNNKKIMKNTYSIGILSSNLLVQTKDTPLLLLNHNKNNLKAIIISLSR